MSRATHFCNSMRTVRIDLITVVLIFGLRVFSHTLLYVANVDAAVDIQQEKLIRRLDLEFLACARRYSLPLGDFPKVSACATPQIVSSCCRVYQQLLCTKRGVLVPCS